MDLKKYKESEMEKYPWVAFYKELAAKLLPYRKNRQELVNKVYQVYNDTGIGMPKLDYGGKLVDIDPFTVFGLFNKPLTTKKRALIVGAMARVFNMQTEVPQDYNGIPTLNPLVATFYIFLPDRSEDVIDKLWDLFEEALKYKPGQERNRLEELINEVVAMKYNGVAKVTMGLFWIAPDLYMNLDSRNRWYIYESGRLPEEVLVKLPAYSEVAENFSARAYFDLTEQIREYLEKDRQENLIDFSAEAWRYSEQVNQERKQKRKEEEEAKLKNGGLGDSGIEKTRYWIYSPGRDAEKWEEFYENGVMGIGWGKIGDLNEVLKEKDDVVDLLRDEYGLEGSLMNVNLCLYEFYKIMQPGDVIFVKHGRHRLIGRGIVESDYYYDENRDDDFKHMRRVKWADKGEWPTESSLAMKTLTELTRFPKFVEELNDLIDETKDLDYDGKELIRDYPKYTMEDFLAEVYGLDEDSYNELAELLMTKKNIILQGVPGVGKTYAAKRLAYSLMGEKNPERVCLIQFHQSYSYEDFMEGYRPSVDGEGFELKKGVFYNFCEKARKDPENDYFFIIDEINRGNLSKIFGELFMLIEADKRNDKIGLLYSDEEFQVPPRVYIIGMMNTADRSLAFLDYALRRRFAFFELEPAFDSEGFVNYQRQLNNERFDSLINAVERVNNMIENDVSLGKGFRIGHSYFCNIDVVNDKKLYNIVKYEILPLLREYWFDNEEEYNKAKNILESAI